MRESQLGPRITVITPTARWGGIDIWKNSLLRQDFPDFVALLLDEKYEQRAEKAAGYLQDSRLHHIKPPAKRPDAFWNLSASLNYGLELSRSELIVFLQDYIYLPPDALTKFWNRYQELGDCLITGVGHKGQFPEWAINLFGPLTIFTKTGDPNKVTHDQDEPEWGDKAPTGQWFRDPRISIVREGDPDVRPCAPIEFEFNWCAFPYKIALELGGLDEDFDAGWGYDNTNFADRAQALGYNCYMDTKNECVGFSHELLFKEHDLKRDAPNNEELWKRKLDALKEGTYSPKVKSSFAEAVA